MITNLNLQQHGVYYLNPASGQQTLNSEPQLPRYATDSQSTEIDGCLRTIQQHTFQLVGQTRFLESSISGYRSKIKQLEQEIQRLRASAQQEPTKKNETRGIEVISLVEEQGRGRNTEKER